MTLNFTHPNPKPGDPILASDEQIIRDTLRRLTGSVDAGSDDAAGVHHRQSEPLRGFWARIHGRDSVEPAVYDLERIALKSDPEPVQVGKHYLRARAAGGEESLPEGLIVFVERLPVAIGFGGSAAYRFTVPDGQMEFPARITASAESGLHSWIELQATAAGWQNHPDGRSGTLDARALDGSQALENEVVLMVVRPNADSDWSPRFIRQPPTLAEGSNITIDESVSGGSLTLTINATGELTINFTGDDWINVDLVNETITHNPPAGESRTHDPVERFTFELEDAFSETPSLYEVPRLIIEHNQLSIDVNGHIRTDTQSITEKIDVVDMLYDSITAGDGVTIDKVGNSETRKQLEISASGSSGGGSGDGIWVVSKWIRMGPAATDGPEIELDGRDWRGRPIAATGYGTIDGAAGLMKSWGGQPPVDTHFFGPDEDEDQRLIFMVPDANDEVRVLVKGNTGKLVVKVGSRITGNTDFHLLVWAGPGDPKTVPDVELTS